MISVVSENKNVVFWNYDGAKLIFGVLRGEGLFLHHIIDVELSSSNLDFISFDGNNSLDQCLAAFPFIAILFDDIFERLGWIENDHLVPVKWLDTFCHFLDRKLVTHIEGWIHRKTRDEPGFYNGESNQQGDEKTQKVSLNVFSAFLGSNPTSQGTNNALFIVPFCRLFLDVVT